jgi:hypothetical protein
LSRFGNKSETWKDLKLLFCPTIPSQSDEQKCELRNGMNDQEGFL